MSNDERPLGPNGKPLPLTPAERQRRRRQRRKVGRNEIAMDVAVSAEWTTQAQRTQAGRRLLAHALAMGMRPADAVEHVCAHPYMMDPKTRRGPARSTVYKWFQQIGWADVGLDIDEQGNPIDVPSRIDLDEERRKLLGRLDASILRWLAESRALAAQADVSHDLEQQAKLHRAQVRCEREAREYLVLKVRILHLDKIPPLERLDDPEVRRVLRAHIERSLPYFSAEERALWREVFTEQTFASTAEAAALVDELTGGAQRKD